MQGNDHIVNLSLAPNLLCKGVDERNVRVRVLLIEEIELICCVAVKI